jgi:hypothetical protein
MRNSVLDAAGGGIRIKNQGGEERQRLLKPRAESIG